MSYINHAENIRRAIADLRANRLKETTLMVLDEIALIKRRVINEATSAEGGDFGGYSDSVVPGPYYIPKLVDMGFTNPIAKVKDIQKKEGYFFSYKAFRKHTGRRYDKKNFSLSGKMWKGVVAQVLSNTRDATTYVLGSDDPEIQEIINYNKNRDGDFLAVSKEEDALLAKLNEERVLNTLRKHNVI